MTKTPSQLTVLALAFAVPLLAGCSARTPRYLIVLPDVSGSIDPASSDALQNGLLALLQRMERGDRLVVIPVLSDAESDLPGNILRFDTPLRREPYDYDMKKFRVESARRLGEFHQKAQRLPGRSTDLLGTLRAVEEEIRLVPRHYRTAVIMLSDYIQDDRQFNFRVDSRFRSYTEAKELVNRLTQGQPRAGASIPAFLGYLQSRDLQALSRARRDAIQQFWLAYLSARGFRPTLGQDGPGLLSSYLDAMDAEQTLQEARLW